MKNIKCCLVIFMLIASSAINAQPGDQRREKIESMKIGFLTEKLDLTPEEAKVFWPVYNAYSAELEKIRKPRRENISDVRQNLDELSNTDLEKIVDSEIAFRQNELDIVKKYHPHFKQVLPVKKVAKLYRAEEGFKAKLLEMIRERNGGMGRRGQ